MIPPSLNILATVGSSPDSGRTLERLLPADKAVAARVVAVQQEPTQANVYRIQLQLQGRLLELLSQQPLQKDQSVSLQRQADGRIQLQPAPTPAPAAASPTARTPAAETAPAPRIQLPASSRATLEQAMTLNPGGKVSATVISSQAAPPRSPAGNPAPAAAPASGGASPAVTGNPPVVRPATAGAGRETPAPVPGQPASSKAAGQPQSQPQSQPQTQTQPSLPPRPQSPAPAQSAPPATSPGGSSTPPAATSRPAPDTATRPAAVAPAATPNIRPAAAPEASPRAQTQKPTGAPSIPPPATTAAAEGHGVAPRMAGPAVAPAAPPANPASATTTATNATTAPSASFATTEPASPSTTGAQRITAVLENGARLLLQADRPLPQGTQLTLLRQAGGALTITSEPPQPGVTSALESRGVQDALRQALPQQISLAGALTQLNQLGNQPQASTLAPLVRSMLQLFGVRPGSTDAPETIRRNVELGGQQTESRLAQQRALPASDMKFQLQQLRQAATPLPPEARSQLEQLIQGVQSRVTSQQVTALQQWRELPDGQSERVLQLDLPVRIGERLDNLTLRISRETEPDERTRQLQSLWRVRLHFDLAERGGVDAEIRLTDHHRLAARFWCEQIATREALQQQLDSFSQRLRSKGFTQTELQCHHGKAPAQKNAVHKCLIDLRA